MGIYVFKCILYITLFDKEPSSKPSSRSSLFLGLFSSNSSTKRSLIVP